jgi:hypothetical protein
LVNAREAAYNVLQAQLALSGQCVADLRSHAIDRAYRYSVTYWVGGGLKTKANLEQRRGEISVAGGPALDALQVGVPGAGISTEAMADSVQEPDCGEIEPVTSNLDQENRALNAVAQVNNACADSSVKEQN